jgi:glycosyltransferase involved in cell wall biosynthesis
MQKLSTQKNLATVSQDLANAVLSSTIDASLRNNSRTLFHKVEHAGYGAILSRLMTGFNRSLELGANYSYQIDSPYSIDTLFDTPCINPDVKKRGRAIIHWDFFKDTWNAPLNVRANTQYPKCPLHPYSGKLTRHQWCSILAHAICGNPKKPLQDAITTTKTQLGWDAYDLIIGLHIRKGDKNTEAPYIPTEIYLRQVNEISAKQKGKKIAVFLASDDPNCINELQQKIASLPILWDETESRFNNYNAGMVKKSVDLAYQESLTAAKNISLLGQCDYVIGMSSAQFTWIGGLLCIFNHGLDTSRQIMIDPISLKRGHWASAYGFNQEGEWPLTVLHVIPDENGGGAAKAAYRIHSALKKNGVNSQMLVLKKKTDDQSVRIANASLLGKIRNFFHKKYKKCLTSKEKFFATTNQTLHSFGKTSRGIVNEINQSNANIINLHWIAGMLSIEDIAKIKKPLVWTLHDMWPFCGGEHYAESDSETARFRLGYKPNNRPSFESGPDLNLEAWSLKKKIWTKPFPIIAPSRWMRDCVQNSALMHDWPTAVIPNSLDTETWNPINRRLARKQLGLPIDKKLICFGAMGGVQTQLKGFDLLSQALSYLQDKNLNLELVIFGQSRPEKEPNLGFPLHYTGHISDEKTLQMVYSAVDAFIIPSRMDNLPNTGVESMACGTPVVAFDACGLKDIVTHQENGWLAKAFDTRDLARGIEWTIENKDRHQKLCLNAREFAVSQFSNAVIAEKYLNLYKKFLAMQKVCE